MAPLIPPGDRPGGPEEDTARSAPASDPPAAPFPRHARVLKRWEFQQIQKHGWRAHSDAFVVIGCPAVRHKRAPALRGEGARLGMAVSKKVGSAVVRNRLRRLIREVFRAARPELPTVELVVIAKPPAAALARGGLEALRGVLLPQLRSAVDKAGRGPRRRRPRS